MANKFFVDLDNNTPEDNYNNTSTSSYHDIVKNEARNEEIKNNTSDIVKIIRILVFLIVFASTVYMLYQVYDRQKVKKPVENNNPVVTTQTPKPTNIEVNDSLINRLRGMIPKNNNCNTLFPNQYTKGVYYDSNINQNELKSTNCSIVPRVYSHHNGYSSDSDHVYLYDVIIIYDPVTKYYGRSYGNFNIEYSDVQIEMNNSGKMDVTVESFALYGQSYKYTFTLVDNDVYLYTSTEPVTASDLNAFDENAE